MSDFIIMTKWEKLKVFQHSFDIKNVFNDIEFIRSDLEPHKRGKEPDASFSNVAFFSFQGKGSHKSQSQLLSFQIDWVFCLEGYFTPDFSCIELFNSSLFDHDKENLQYVGISGLTAEFVLEKTNLADGYLRQVQNYCFFNYSNSLSLSRVTMKSSKHS